MRTFERDDSAYRQERAVEAFNCAAEVVKWMKVLYPTVQSACAHVALCVVPRQMAEHGDLGRRSTDHSESFGASVKDGIHRRCLWCKLSKTAETHKSRKVGANGDRKVWVQKGLSCSRVMQAFRDIAVKERLLRDEGSAVYLQRHHFRLKTTGFATVGEAAAAKEAPKESAIFDALLEKRRAAKRKAAQEEGGEEPGA
eukprot:7384711-Prymnesium_polylepis.1